MLADLHMHTTFSDGVNTPEELVREAEKAHLCAMAITDLSLIHISEPTRRS